jgi:hypothetical protein
VKNFIKPLFFDTYISVIKNSDKSQMFRSLYAKINGKKTDITKNGSESCAFYVSSVLFLFKLIKEIHATVNGTIKDLENSGWKKAKKPKIGCVLVWAEKKFKDGPHKHIGFYMGNDMAISNSSKYKYPTKHKWNEYDGRKIEMILLFPKKFN